MLSPPLRPSERAALPQLNERRVAQADVDGLALHMEAAGRHPFASVPKHFVGGGRAVAGDDLIRPVVSTRAFRL
jgi:hypothetical protein